MLYHYTHEYYIHHLLSIQHIHQHPLGLILIIISLATYKLKKRIEFELEFYVIEWNVLDAAYLQIFLPERLGCDPRKIHVTLCS